MITFHQRIPVALRSLSIQSPTRIWIWSCQQKCTLQVTTWAQVRTIFRNSSEIEAYLCRAVGTKIASTDRLRRSLWVHRTCKRRWGANNKQSERMWQLGPNLIAQQNPASRDRSAHETRWHSTANDPESKHQINYSKAVRLKRWQWCTTYRWLIAPVANWKAQLSVCARALLTIRVRMQVSTLVCSSQNNRSNSDW